ncbi:MAG TPA: homoserine kinase [Actinomycetota bacterium]|nr:homoserine kinase [Actinomycetota bacterium]
MRLRVEVPATVANLGPGFDAFGLAVGLSNVVTVDTDAEPRILVEGEGAGELPEDGSNLVVRAMAMLAVETGRKLPPFALRCENGIPLARGLGSSASALVAGLALADRLLGTNIGLGRLLTLSADAEGHADNVAPALLGGATIAYLSADGWRAERLPSSNDLHPVLLIPLHERVSTEDARRVLPREVPRVGATFNAARAGLLVLALGGRTELLPEALEDRLHQDARLKLAPGAQRVFQDIRASGVPVCVAGSGPTLLAFDTGGAAIPELGASWRVIPTAVQPNGAEVLELL